jgi:hypothetical protein
VAVPNASRGLSSDAGDDDDAVRNVGYLADIALWVFAVPDPDSLLRATRRRM